MYKEYSDLKKLVNVKIIRDILSISKSIGLHQKIVQYSTYCYIKYVHMSNKVTDCSQLITSSILLGCKIANFVPKFDIILENVFINYNMNLNEKEMKEFKEKVLHLELNMSISLDFDFNIQDQYIEIMNYGNELNKDIETKNMSEYHKLIIRTLWILMNDSLFYPFRLFFDQEVIFKSCLYLSYKIHNNSNKVEQILADKSKSEISFIAEEMIDGYYTNKIFYEK